MVATNNLQTISCKSSEEWEKWLAKNHKKSSGIWLRIFKKESGRTSATYAEALDSALCYGWIDGQKNKYDNESWLQKFTPRRPKSMWSKVNTAHVKRLINAGRMKSAGFHAIETAKQNGRWTSAYDSPSKAVIPVYFLKELLKSKKAKTFFNTLNKTNLYSISWRLQTAKKPETRQKRMKIILEMLENNKKFH